MAVIFIPGIKGTELVDTYPLRWPQRWSTRVGDPLPLALVEGRHDAAADHWVQPGRVIPEFYASCIRKLREWLAPEPVYAFGYDWRLPMEASAQRLANLLDEVRARERLAGRSLQPRFVTHSMGGLLLRSALAMRNRRDPFADVGRTVFIAPPFRGSIGAPYALVAGEVDAMFGTNQDQRHIVRGFPSVYQMTPSWPGAAVAEDGADVDLFDPANWQANVRDGAEFQPAFLRNAEALVRGRRARHAGRSQAPMLADAAMAGAADKVLIICGSGRPTPCALPVLTRNRPNPNWFDFANATMDTRGDGRVWLPSAAVKGVRLAAFTDSGEHGMLCRDARVVNLTSAWLQGRGAPMLQPRRAGDPLRRKRRQFPAWDGQPDSFERHIA